MSADPSPLLDEAQHLIAECDRLAKIEQTAGYPPDWRNRADSLRSLVAWIEEHREDSALLDALQRTLHDGNNIGDVELFGSWASVDLKVPNFLYASQPTLRDALRELRAAQKESPQP